MIVGIRTSALLHALRVGLPSIFSWTTMSSDKMQDFRFIEVSQVIITDPLRKSWGGDYRVLVKHERGTEETIRSSRSGAEAVIDCKTFVQLHTKTTVQIHRAKRIETVASGVFVIIGEEGKDYKVDMSGKPGLAVTLKLGNTMTMAQVAEARIRDANEVLEKQSKSAEDLERITGHVKVLVDVLDVAAKFDPFPFAEGVVGIAKMVLKQTMNIPTEYKALKDVALDCIEQIRFDENARKVFTTDRVRLQMNSVMGLVIQVLEFIFHHCSQPRISLLNRTNPSDFTINRMKDLASKLKKQKEQIRDAFILELREGQFELREAIANGQHQIMDEMRRLKPGGGEQHVPNVSQEKEGWVFVDNPAEPDVLKRFLGTIGGVSKGKAPCLPDTRVSILQTLSSWAQEDSPEAPRLFWLYGVAGCGKSAVAVSISQKLVDVKRLAGSFFCRRDEVGRRNPVQLFGYLASRIAERSPTFKEALLESLGDYSLLDSRDPATFVAYTLKKPLAKATNCAPVTFVIDALDECNDSGTVAGFLTKIVAQAPWIKLIVTSREEPDIKKTFAKSKIPKAEHDLFEDDAQTDILTYLHTRLDEFQDLHCYIEELVVKAGGLFIWLHTVTEVIFNAKLGRKKLIQAFLKQPLSGDAEKRMAETYLTVLQQASGCSAMAEAIVRAIAGLLLATSSNAPLTINGLYAFLPPTLAGKATFDEFSELVMALKPVLKLTPTGDLSEEAPPPQYRFYVQTHHASFLDFCAKPKISNKSESGAEVLRPNPFWTNPVALHRDVAMGCLEIMKIGKRAGRPNPNETLSGLRFNICGLNTSHKLNSEIEDLDERVAARIPPHLLYSCSYWASHVFKSSLDESSPACGTNQTDVREAISDLLETTRLLFWLEALSLMGNLSIGREVLVNISVQTKTKALLRFSGIASEMFQFVEQCFLAISSSTPHLYISLAWLPVDSQLWTIWKREFSRAMILKDSIGRGQSTQLIYSNALPARVDTFAISPDRRHIVSGSTEGYVRLWNLGSVDKPVKERQVSPGTSPIGALAYALDGLRILCICNGFIYELDPETLSPMEEGIPIRHTDVRCMAVSEAHIALGMEVGRVAILDAKTFQEVLLEQPDARTEAVDTIAISPDGTRLVYAAGWGTYVCTWDAASRSYRHVDTPLGWSGYATAVAFSPDGKYIATGNCVGGIRWFDTESGEELGHFLVYGFVQFLTFSYGTRIICALASKWRPEDLPPSSEVRHCIVLGNRCLVEETSIQIWDVDFSSCQQTRLPGHMGNTVNSVAFSPEGKKIVTGSDDHSVRVWDAQTGKQEKLAEMTHSDYVRFVTYSPHGKFIASGGDNVIRIWDALTGKPVRVLEGHTGWVNCGVYSPDGMSFVSGSVDKTVRMWDVRRKKRKMQLRRILHVSGSQMTHGEDSIFSGHEDSVRSVAFSPGGSYIASASNNSTIRFWDAKARKALGDPLHGHDGVVSSITFSPDGRRLVSGGNDNIIRIWNVETRSGVGEPFQGHSSYDSISSVAFSPDGAFIFSTSRYGIIRCWDAITGNPVGHPLENDCTNSIAVSPDGQRIVSGSSNGCIRVWDSQAFNWELDESFLSCGHRSPNRIPVHIPEDGWIRTAQGELLLWVPVEHREAVCRLDLFSFSKHTTGKSIRIMWNELYQGENWTQIRNGE